MIAFRSTTDAMLAARFDPEPYVDQHGIYRNPDGDPAGFDFDARFHFDPRPELIPSREHALRAEHERLMETPVGSVSEGRRIQRRLTEVERMLNSTRPEPNPILVVFRELVESKDVDREDRPWWAGQLARVLEAWEDGKTPDADIYAIDVLRAIYPTVAQTNHARRVLTKIAHVYRKA